MESSRISTSAPERAYVARSAKQFVAAVAAQCDRAMLAHQLADRNVGIMDESIIGSSYWRASNPEYPGQHSPACQLDMLRVEMGSYCSSVFGFVVFDIALKPDGKCFDPRRGPRRHGRNKTRIDPAAEQHPTGTSAIIWRRTNPRGRRSSSSSSASSSDKSVSGAGGSFQYRQVVVLPLPKL